MLKEYTEAFGVSGCENEIRKTIKNQVESFGEVRIDKMGNLIVHKRGNGKKVMLSAHMDEVGFIVTKIFSDGRIRFSTVGNIDSRILMSKRIVFIKNGIKGVIGGKPIHLQSPSEKTSPIDKEDLFIDIGVSSKEEAQRYVELGDYATFDSEYVDMGSFIKAKALDSRAGCAIVTELLKDEYDLDVYGVFTVQQQVGIRGAGIAAFSIEPDVAIVIEGTLCADMSSKKADYVTECGMGPAISLMDDTSSVHPELLKRIVKASEKSNITYQYRTGTMGRNDAGRIHKTKAGCETAVICVPTRYIHTPVSMINKEDYRNTIRLVKEVLISLGKGEDL